MPGPLSQGTWFSLRIEFTRKVGPGIERVLALDVKTGDIRWQHEYECQYNISYPAGPRATPVFDEGRLYTIGAVGHLFCLDAKTGEVIWSKNFPR